MTIREQGAVPGDVSFPRGPARRRAGMGATAIAAAALLMGPAPAVGAILVQAHFRMGDHGAGDPDALLLTPGEGHR